jgi:hypothetical protein
VTLPDVLTRRLAKSRGRDLALGAMRVYLVAAVALMVVSIVQLAH